jgi:hypothetical protein
MMDRLGGVLAIDADQVGPGLVALLFVLGLAVALVFLLRSLNKQLKRINFEQREDRPEAGSARNHPSPDDRDRPADDS